MGDGQLDLDPQEDEHVLFIEWLGTLGTTVWGRGFDVKTKGAPAAATWFLDQRDRYEKWKANR